MKKRIISIILVFSILLSCGIMTASAQTEDDNTVTFYFHCPENFTKDGKIRCGLTPKDNNLSADVYYGEPMGNGLYKFVLPDLSSYFWLIITNDVEPISEADPEFNATDAFLIEEGNCVYDYGSDKEISINNRIYTNCIQHWGDWNYYYGYGDWMDFEEWDRYQAYLKYISNENYECYILDSLYYEEYWYKYKELYTFNDNVLTFGADKEKIAVASYGVYGDYVLRNNESYSPSVFGYNVYVSESDEVISLREAYDTNIDGIDSVFTDYGLGELIGDLDNDKSITIFDATIIQQNLAKISDFADNDEIQGNCEEGSTSISYISDFNRDAVRNIMDATAIQIHLAKKQ